MPLRNVRRGRDFFLQTLVRGSPHLKRRTFHDRGYKGRDAIIVFCRIAGNGPDRWLVIVFDAAAQCVGQKLSAHGGHKFVAMREEDLAQFGGSREFSAVGKLAGDVDHGTGVFGPPFADAVEVFERKSERVHAANGTMHRPNWRDAAPSAGAW